MITYQVTESLMILNDCLVVRCFYVSLYLPVCFSYNDDIGRQIVLSEGSIEALNKRLRKENKVFCFPAR